MNFIIKYASDWERTENITFNSLEELADFQKSVKHQLVIRFDDRDGNNYILIYDDYIE